MREWILDEVHYGFVKENRYEVAVLPMGATEPHNLHLPYGTDTFEAQAFKRDRQGIFILQILRTLHTRGVRNFSNKKTEKCENQQ